MRISAHVCSWIRLDDRTYSKTLEGQALNWRDAAGDARSSLSSDARLVTREKIGRTSFGKSLRVDM